MINGVPQNDMENGWVYWSNWDGVGDATHSIQMQRGLSAVNLATPSIGGSLNIITDPTAASKGGFIKQEVGAGSFLKTSMNYNTGLIGDNLALSATIVRKTGEGVVDRTWTDAWAYYFGASYQLNEANRFEVYAIGAPQRHGQNLYKQNIAAYSEEYARELYSDDILAVDDEGDEDADGNDIPNGTPDIFDKFMEHEDGRIYNENASDVSSSYKGQQYWYMYGEGGLFGGGLQDRHDPNFLNERENFFHKPLVNLNHYLTLNDQMRLSTVAYWSGGSGGGTGTYASMRYNYHKGISSPSRWVHYDATIERNSTNIDSSVSETEARSLGILRNSINRQNTYGLISKLNYDLSDAIQLQFGLDWRTAGIEHTREVRDLLGGDYFIDYSYDDDDNIDGMVNPNETLGTKSYLGDNIDYHNNTTVDWLGFFGQGSYSSGPINAYGMAGFSTISYTYQDHFTVEDLLIEADAISTMQFKGGAMYDVADGISVFANFGMVEKPPIMDNIIYYDGTVASDPVNEKFQSMEAGVNYNVGKYAVKANFYNTDWKDRNLTKQIETGAGDSGDTDVIFLTGVNQNHSGVEVEASAQLIDMLRLDVALSFGDWSFVDDANGTYKDAAGVPLGEYSYALKDLKVGDMPQTSYVAGVTLTPMSGLKIQALYNMYADNYSDWSPGSREIGDDGTADTDQVWMAPSYSKLDVHINYDLPVSIAGTQMTAFAHIFNALDAVYVQDAVDNSNYNSWGTKEHKAWNAEVFLGAQRYFNAGLKVNF
jgi:hypothetical protein